MGTKKYILFGSLIAVTVMVIVAYNYVYREHRQIDKEAPKFHLSASDLQNDMLGSDDGQKYVDQVIQTYGVITSASEKTIVIDNKVQVSFLAAPNIELKEGKNIYVKGRCVGHDDLLEVVKLDQATLVTNPNERKK